MKNIPYLRIDNEEIIEDEAFAFESAWLRGNGFEFAKDLPALVKELETMPTTFLIRTKELIDANLQSDEPFDLSKGIFYPLSDLYATLHETKDFNLLFSPMEEPGRSQAAIFQAFLKVDENRPEMALRFIRRYGTLGFGDHFKPEPFGRFGGDIEPWDYFRTKLIEFKQVMATYRILKVEKLSKELRHKLYLALKLTLHRGLEKVTPCLVSGQSDEDSLNKLLPVDSRFLAGYHCATLLSAIYLQFYLDMTNPNGTLKQCDHCYNWFIVGTNSFSGKGRRRDSKYCMKSCQNAHMQARRRAREKLEEQKKGR